MNITPTIRQITDFSFTISSQDLERYLADPQAWAADVKAQLNGHVTSAGHLVAGPNENGGHAPKDPAGAPAHARRQPKRHAPTRRAKPAKSSSTRKSKHQTKPGADLICPDCGEVFTKQGWLARHITKMHPESTPAAQV